MIDQNTIENRIKQLKEEMSKGQTQLEKLEKERESTQQTLLRISGAIQVLEEMLQEPTQAQSLKKVAAVE